MCEKRGIADKKENPAEMIRRLEGDHPTRKIESVDFGFGDFGGQQGWTGL